MSLNEKAIDIKGKKYVLVSDRIIYFNETYPSGSIQTELLSNPNDERVVVKAIVTPDGKRMFNGLSQAVVGDGYINKTSALENCETSAVGRALAMMGIGVIDSVTSYDEINKTTYPQEISPKATQAPMNVPKTKDDKQDTIKKIITMCDNLDTTLIDNKKYNQFIEDKCGVKVSESNFEHIIKTLNELN